MLYHSVDEFLAAASKPQAVNPSNQHWVEYFRRDVNGSGYRWYGLNAPSTPEKLAATVRAGWPEGLARIDAALSSAGLGQITPPIMQKRRKRTGDVGDELDIHRVWAGDLDHAWTATRREARIGPRNVTIVADIITPALESADVSFWRGAAAIRLSDLLSEAGYVVRIVGAAQGQIASGAMSQFLVVVKDYAAPLDKAIVAAAVAYPPFTRHFGVVWTHLHATGFTDGGTSSVRRYEATGPDELIVPHAVRDAYTAAQWVEQEIRTINELHQQQEAA